MTVVNIKLTPKEIKLLADLASDQLFRREFIDPKMPGVKCDWGEVSLGKDLVGRLRTASSEVNGGTTVRAKSMGGFPARGQAARR